jgi:hypothetical protein
MAKHRPTNIPLFSDPARKLAFTVGVAHANNLLPAHLLMKWRAFLRDTLAGKEYEVMDILLEDLRIFVYGPLGPSREMVEDAKEGWRALVGLALERDRES